MAGQKTLYWYDYETFGANPMYDRLVQFAGVRTDEDLNIIGEPLMMYCKPADDFLPQPISSLITGITPQKALLEGIPEAEFIRRINAEFSQPNTCVLGYNNLRFDDEFTRYSLYRNLLDPYAREWRDGCSRWDLLDVVRMTRALRPEGIVWPSNDEGRPSVRLEDLTKANQVSHESAHDALSDVYATISIARLIKEKQPKLYDYAYQNRGKNQVLKMLNLREQKPVIHISGMYPVEQGNMAIVVPIANHPTNKNGVMVFDLSHDPTPLFKMNVEEIHERIFTPTAEMAEGVDRLPIKTVHANKCPIIAPMTTLSGAQAKKYGIDLNVIRNHLAILTSGAPLNKKLQQVLNSTEFEKRTDPDYMLYGGPFFSQDDRARMDQIQQLSPQQLADHQPVFDDKRLPEMLFRYRARNWPESLSVAERAQWDEFRAERLTKQEGERLNFAAFFDEIERLRAEPDRLGPDWAILDELESYGKALRAGV
ncbi:MAG: exodeoxyribonuclease I [Gammaproteobacteria bacterium]|nr:exodeoxyribonuclease I [Gammaproteobacteria bacterium]